PRSGRRTSCPRPLRRTAGWPRSSRRARTRPRRDSGPATWRAERRADVRPRQGDPMKKRTAWVLVACVAALAIGAAFVGGLALLVRGGGGGGGPRLSGGGRCLARG